MAFDPLSAAFEIGSKIIDRVWPNPAEAAKAKMELYKMQQDGELQVIAGQMEINKIEAANPSVFVSGWRPFIGWGCGFAFLYSALFEPFLRFIATVVFSYAGAFPSIDTNLTMQVMLGLLGLAGLRTYEKTKDVAAK